MDLTVVGNNKNNNNNNNNMLLRDYRKGNWNLQETMVLIEAKRMDDDRRSRRLVEAYADRGKPAELRWKWVEDYCWKHGCLRSQNQCNDKWDNLMRDFKKVREFQTKIPAAGDSAAAAAAGKSYWRMEKNERKDRNLPSNMLPEVYEALVDVAERRAQSSSAAAGGHAVVVVTPPPEIPPGGGSAPASSPIVDSETSEYSGSPAKRRKRRVIGEGTAAMKELGSAIEKSASTIAEAIQSSEEREERRHREVLRVHERRLEIEEGNGGLVEAINKLANSIFALAAHNNNPSPSK